VAFIWCIHHGHAQQFSISIDSIVSCMGVLVDTGGSGGEYGNDENFTSTVCPVEPGGNITLNWVVFNLSTDGTQSSWDKIEVWDGNSTSATFLGAYTGSSLSGLVISATMNNPSGCLTVRFTSNSIGTGDFAAGISCGGSSSGCDQPVAIDNTIVPDDSVLCLGDTLFLDGSNSIPYPGTTITEWQWTTGLSVPFVTDSPIDTLVITEAGVVALQLQVTSNTNCASAVSGQQIILVSGPISFVGTVAPETVCIPGTVDFVGNATLEPFVQVSFTGGQFGLGIELPDDVGVPFISSATYTEALPEATISDPAEIGDICVEMEHSFIGDFVMELECPNGQSVVLHQQGGGGTFIGDANDLDLGSDPVPGACWEYCFNSTPDYGTWADCSSLGPTPNVVPTSQWIALAPGSYTPVTSLDELIGCPFNGEWTLTIIDLWGADNGFLCSWSLGFTVEVDSSYISSSGSLDLLNEAQTFWTGPNIVPTADPTIASAPFDGLDEYDFTFTVIDSYGCSYDTTLTVNGYNAPEANAGSDISLCSATGMLEGAAEFGIPDSCTYRLQLQRNSNTISPGSGVVSMIILGDTTNFTYNATLWVTYPISIAHGTPIEIYYTSGNSNSNHLFRLFDPRGTVLYNSGYGPPTGSAFSGIASCAGIIPPTGSITWSPQTGLENANSPVTEINAPAQGWYTLTVGYPNGCSTSDSVLVTNETGQMALQWNTSTALLCVDPSINGNYMWYRNGTLNTTSTTPCLSAPAIGLWNVIAEPAGGCVYVSDSLLICPIITLSLSSNGATILSVGDVGGQYSWTLNGEPVMGGGPYLPITFSGTYTLTNTLANGCVTTASIDILLPVDINGASSTSPFRIIPNPNNGAFKIQYEGVEGRSCVLELRDVTGRLVSTEQFKDWSDPQSIQVGHLTQGTYFVDLISGSERHIGKLILER